MNSKLEFSFRFLKYLWQSQTRHDIHSPFVYDLLTNVIKDKFAPEAFKKIEDIRIELLRSDAEISVNDLGAGSVFGAKKKRKISQITKDTSKQPKYAQLLYRLAEHFQSKTILELGTSLGISTAYLAAVKGSKVITIEGCAEKANVAKNNFSKINLDNIAVVVGNFDEKLSTVLDRTGQLDFVFFDGNHRKEPTLNYFELCLNKAHNNTVFVFDDIHWSNEMEDAWNTIKANAGVTVTVDLFFLGLVFLRKEQTKQHFIIKY